MALSPQQQSTDEPLVAREPTPPRILRTIDREAPKVDEMEAAPPSYDYAISRNHWPLIAPYVRSRDLNAACLVNKSWHRSFAPQLWGNPSYHFSLLLEDPWLGFRKFERIIQTVARHELRLLTHTLQVPADTHSLHEEIYSSRWLFNVLNRLPRLQCLLVPNVSSFDHETLYTLRRSTLPNYEQSEASSHESFLSTNHMRLLDASNCRNVTSTGLLIAFEVFPNLMYLDLSGVPAASFAETPSKLRRLQDLKVLNLRRVRLTDTLLSVLASNIGQRVRCLDIRENPTTEKSFETLLESCIGTQGDPRNSDQGLLSDDREPSDAPPSYAKQASPMSLQGQDFGDSLYKALTRGPINRLALQDSSEVGITDLRMSMKSITARNLFAAFRSHRLQYLDIDCAAVQFSPQINILHHSAENLESLRIHHSLVTGLSTREPYLPTDASIPGSLREVAERRRVRAQNGRTNFQNITASLPALKILILTGLPNETMDSTIARRVIDLLKNCAINARLAKAQASKERVSNNETTHSILAENKRAKILFPLEKIVLELAPPKFTSQKQLSKGWNYREDTKAVTEDKDSEALWKAAGTDFSFFDNEDHSNEPDVRLETITSRDANQDKGVLDSHSHESAISVVDVVGEITAHRKASRKKYESAVARGNGNEPFSEFWTGIVSLVRV